MTRGYSFGDTRVGTIHSFMGCTPAQSKHLVTSNRVAQCGQAACVWNVSNGWPHREHFQKSPMGGAVLHLGQANHSRRGNFAKRDNACAWRRPLQQFERMKTERMPSQRDCIHRARTTNPAAPNKPMIAATIKLRARPTRNHS